MSDTPKVEEPVVPVTEEAPAAAAAGETPAATEPVTEASAATETVAEAPAAVEAPKEDVVTEPAKEPVADELQKTGLLKGFQQKFAGILPKKAEKAIDSKEEAPATDASPTEKIRSASRKRNSIFGGFGKKLEPKEEVAAAEPTLEETAAAAERVPESATEPVAVEPVTETADSTPEKITTSKRASIFGTLKSQFAKKDKTEAAPVATAKEAEPVSETAPVIPAVESSEPLAGDAPTPEVAAPADTPDATNGEAKSEAPVTKSEKRKSTLPFGLGLSKKEKPVSEGEDPVEKPLSPFAKLRATVKSKTSPKAAAAAAEAKAEEPKTEATPNEAKVEETAATDAVAEPGSVVPSNAAVTASA